MSGFIALPSGAPGGMEAPLDAHFGHCQMYTLVEVEDGKVIDTKVIPNVPHQQGGCMAPVNHLAQNKVNWLISGGMGMRPLQGFGQVGIEVFYSGGLPTVGLAVEAFLAGKLQSFTPSQTCGGAQADHGCENH